MGATYRANEGDEEREREAAAAGLQGGIDRCSGIAYRHAKSTFSALAARGVAGVEGEDDSFANILRIGNVRVAVTSDGIGTKVDVAERVGLFDTLGFDLVAMVVDDLVAIGAEPLALSNIIDASRLDEATIDAMMRGLAEAARQCGVAVTGGEIAALGERVGGWGDGAHVNWCATALGVLPDGRPPVSGRSIEVGDRVVAMASAGLRSNGFTLARRILQRALGDAWHSQSDGGTDWGRRLLTPSIVYAPSIVAALRAGIPIRGLAHVTGGGIPSNLARVLRFGRCGAALNDLWPPQDWVRRLVDIGGLSARDAYETWNMGNGMLAAVRADDAPRLIAVLGDVGVDGRVAGTVVAEPGIEIDARGWKMGLLRWDRESGDG